MKSLATSTVIRHLRTLTEHPSDVSDDQLLLRYLEQGDETAFAALVQRHGAMVLATCCRVLRHEHETEDAFQATFLVLARRARSVRSHGSLAAWLHSVAHRISLRARTTVARHRSVTLEESVVAAALPDPSWREVSAVLDDELERLPEKLRAPLVLCYLEGLTRDEAAIRLNCPLGTLKGRLERGRDLLRKRLTRRGLGLSAVLTALAVETATLARALAAALANALGRKMSPRVLALAHGFAPSTPGMIAKVALALVLFVGAVIAGATFAPPPNAPPPPAPPAPQAQPKDNPKPRLDAFGDPVPAGAVARLGSLRLYHGHGVYGVVLSPNAKLVAAWDDEGVKRLWDVEKGQERGPFVVQGEISGRPAFSPDEALLAAGENDGVVHLWDVATGRELRTFGEPVKPDPNPTNALRSLAFAPDGRTLAAGYRNRDVGVRLWEVASGQERGQFRNGHRDDVISLAFSPDGSLLVSGSSDRTAVIWDVTGRYTLPPRGPLDNEGLRACWDDLAGSDATKAYQAILALTASGRSMVPFLTGRLQPAAAVEAKVVERLLKDLDSDDFATREKASKDLLELGEAAEEHLRKAQDGDLTAEARRRVERLLTQLDPVNIPERLRGPRAVEALEGIATPEAKQLLQKLAEGDPTAGLTREAKATLQRTTARTERSKD